jgi:hypothetical protein
MNTCSFTIHFKIISVCSKVFVKCKATILSNPHNYPSNDSGRITNTELQLERILLKFHYIEEEHDMCKGQLKHVDMSVRTKRYLRFGAYVCSKLEWHTN